MQIDDGTGNGFKAGVNSHNQLSTRSICSEYHQYISDKHEQAYTAPLGTILKPTLTLTATGGYVMYLKNTSTLYDAVLSRASVTTSALVIMTIVRNPTIGSLANNIDIVPVNKNFKSGKVASVDCVGWDEVGDEITGITGGECVSTYQVNGVDRIVFDEALILGLNDIVAFKAKNVGELSMNLHGYYIIPD